MRKVLLFLTICLLILVTSCEPIAPTLSVSGLEGVTKPETETLLEGITSFSAKMHSKVTGQNFILGFDSNNTPRIIGIKDAKQDAWLWKTIGLRDLADQLGLEIGSGIEGEMFGMPEFYEILNRDFNMVTIHTPFYWYGLEVKQGLLGFDNVDWHIARIKGSSKNTDILVRGHPLIWYSANPQWFENGQFTRDERIKIMQDHVATLMENYADTVSEWVVVNEPYKDNEDGIDLYAKRIGPEYIDLAFQTARETDPSAILILNDYHNETSAGEYTQLDLEIINRLKESGLIDAIGLQMHLDGANPPSREDVVQTMRAYGVPVLITELDVDLSDVTGTQQERFDQQANIYGEMLEACLESGVCISYTMWGIGDKYSWLERDFQRHNSDSTIYDDDFNPKPAYFTLLHILAKTAGAEPKYNYP